MAKKSGSAESGIPFGQGKIKMEVKRRNPDPEGDEDREYFIKVSLGHICLVHSSFIGSKLQVSILLNTF